MRADSLLFLAVALQSCLHAAFAEGHAAGGPQGLGASLQKLDRDITDTFAELEEEKDKKYDFVYWVDVDPWAGGKTVMRQDGEVVVQTPTRKEMWRMTHGGRMQPTQENRPEAIGWGEYKWFDSSKSSRRFAAQEAAETCAAEDSAGNECAQKGKACMACRLDADSSCFGFTFIKSFRVFSCQPDVETDCCVLENGGACPKGYECVATDIDGALVGLNPVMKRRAGGECCKSYCRRQKVTFSDGEDPQIQEAMGTQLDNFHHQRRRSGSAADDRHAVSSVEMYELGIMETEMKRLYARLVKTGKKFHKMEKSIRRYLLTYKRERYSEDKAVVRLNELSGKDLRTEVVGLGELDKKVEELEKLEQEMDFLDQAFGQLDIRLDGGAKLKMDFKYADYDEVLKKGTPVTLVGNLVLQEDGTFTVRVSVDPDDDVSFVYVVPLSYLMPANES